MAADALRLDWLMRRRLLLLGFLTAAAFLMAHLANSLVGEALTPIPPAPPVAAGPAPGLPAQADLRKMAEEVLSSGLFLLPKSGGAAADPAQAPAAALDAARKIKLVGTVMTEGIIPFAVVEELGSKRQTLYHLHEEVPNVGRIAEVRADAILLQQGALQELLELNPGQSELPVAAPAAKPGAPAPGGGATLKRVVDQREVAQNMADLPKLLSEARVGPVYTEGKMDGWKIEAINPKSFYERIGLQAGDVLQRVNGVEIRDPGMILSLFQQLKDEKSVSLDMLRDGRKTTMQFEIR